MKRPIWLLVLLVDSAACDEDSSYPVDSATDPSVDAPVDTVTPDVPTDTATDPVEEEPASTARRAATRWKCPRTTI